MRKTFCALLLSLPGACASPGLTLVDCALAREVLGGNRAGQYGSLRGYVRLRNDTDLDLTRVKVKVHVLDGYGKPLFDLDPGEIGQLKPHQQGELSLYSTYSGGVMQFQLSADVTAHSPQGEQKYTLAARDVGLPSAATKPPGW